jgi:hypothetical protein
MIEFDQIFTDALFAGKALQRSDPQAGNPIRRGEDANARVRADPVGNGCPTVRDEHPFPVGMGLG